MATYDAFLFGSETDLLPVWDNEDAFFFDTQLPDYEFWDPSYTFVQPEPPLPEITLFIPEPTTTFVPNVTFDDWEQPLPLHSGDKEIKEEVLPQETNDAMIMSDTVFTLNLAQSAIITSDHTDISRCVTKQDPYESVPEWQFEQPVRVEARSMDEHEFDGTFRLKKEKRKLEDDLEDFDLDVDGACLEGEEDDPTGGFKLPASKSPIMEAMAVCALNGWGIDIIKNARTATDLVEVVFQVNDFDRYYRISRSICSKQRPTDDVGSRVKSLRRWFVNFPKKKDRNDNVPFLLVVQPNIAKKVSEIIERNTRMLGLTKRRRRQ